MIVVRILDEGQFALPDAARDEVVARDTKLLTALESGDEAAFRGELDALLSFVRASGTEVALDVITPSEFILPNAEWTTAAIHQLLAEHDG
jgi:hypothetical protein